MPSPVAPAQFCDAVPTPNSDLCVKVSKFFGIAQLLCDFFSWFLDTDGAISDTAKTEIAASIVPTGFIMYSASINGGSLWLLANGQAVSRTTYAALFTAIGTRYGAGDGSTTFNLPDLQGRSPIGAGSGSGLTFRDINSPEVGEENHALTEDENGAHRHFVADPNITEETLTANHTLDSRVTNQGALNYTLRGDTSGDATVGKTSESGSGAPHNTVHPSFVLYPFIKV